MLIRPLQNNFLLSVRERSEVKEVWWTDSVILSEVAVAKRTATQSKDPYLKEL
jgi:hypothetical protein